jgi:adenylate kinase
MPKIAIRTVAVLLFGPPGSGKGTISKHLTGCFDIPHISTGDIFREHVASGTELGREVAAIMNSGGLAPDSLVNRVVAERVKRSDCAAGCILDGYPRTLEQAEALSKLLQDLKLEPLVIHLEVDYNRIVSRLTARRSCPACGAVYNLIAKPAKVDGVCDIDGVELITRNDDGEDVISQRFAAYESQTLPLVEYFRRRNGGRFYTVDGNEGSPLEIAERACRLIGHC